MTFNIITFGCQMNTSDSQKITSFLTEHGHTFIKDASLADVIILNMCSVRQSAVDRIYGNIINFKKNPKCKIAIMGCVLKADKEQLEKITDAIFTTEDIRSLLNIFNIPEVKAHNFSVRSLMPSPATEVTGNVPIMAGCNNFCTYCAVPYTRGKEVYFSPKQIIQEVKFLLSKGAKEIWLLGQNVNSYKYSLNGETVDFADLLKMVNGIEGKFWLRFTSPHPKDFPNKLIDTMVDCDKYGSYLNLPVQAGSDKILKAMRRPYTHAKYLALVEKIRNAFIKKRGKFPLLSISTDTIVGFPGETKKDFRDTVSLYKKAKFDQAFIAKFSPRKGTPAAELKDNVLSAEKERRRKELTLVLRKNSNLYVKQFLKKKVSVLITKRKKNYYLGRTFSNKAIRVEGTNLKVGEFYNVKVKGAKPFELQGTVL